MTETETALPPKRRSWIAPLILPMILFLAGGGAIAWLLTQTDFGRELITVRSQENSPAAIRVVAPPLTQQSAPPSESEQSARIAGLEARIAQLESRGSAGGGNAGRAEALLVSFATRRALDQGAPFGVLESELSARFGASNPRAVAAIVDAGKQPVSLAALSQQLQDLAPQLEGLEADAGYWERLTNGLSSLIIIRDANSAPTNPARSVATARSLLANRQYEAAISEISRLPERSRAANWMAAARRFSEAQKALDELDESLFKAQPAPPPPVELLPPQPPKDSGQTIVPGPAI